MRLRCIDDRLVGMLMLDLNVSHTTLAACTALTTAPRVFTACSFIRALYRAGMSSIICVLVVNV